jgi:hypothetical protein
MPHLLRVHLALALFQYKVSGCTTQRTVWLNARVLSGECTLALPQHEAQSEHNTHTSHADTHMLGVPTKISAGTMQACAVADHSWRRICHPLISTYLMATLVFSTYATLVGTSLTAILRAYFVSAPSHTCTYRHMTKKQQHMPIPFAKVESCLTILCHQHSCLSFSDTAYNHGCKS